MASIATSPKGHRRILFYWADKSRRIVHLGKCSMSDATKIKLRVESLLLSKLNGGDPKPDDAKWLLNEGRYVREKLAAVGLCESAEPPPRGPTLAEFLTDFMKRNGPSKKPATRVVWQQVINALNLHLPKEIMLADVTAGHAKGFLQTMARQGSKAGDKAKKLSSTTIHKRISFARQFFQDACDWELIEKNPFAKIRTQGTSLKSNVEVPMETIQTVLKKCDPTWKAIVGLSRIGGFRCPSETLSLTWGDIDWELGRISIPEPKVEHHEGRGVRSCPLFPELRTILEELFEAYTIDGKYPPPESYVIDKPEYRAAAMRPGGWANANLRTQFLKILRRAGVAPWSRLFHSMRATRQTELEREFPLHVVCSWLGNTEAVARKNYLLVTDADFAKATEIRETPGARADQKTERRGTNGALQTTANDTPTKEKTLRISGKSYVFREIHRVFKWRRGELNPRPAILPIRPLHV